MEIQAISVEQKYSRITEKSANTEEKTRLPGFHDSRSNEKEPAVKVDISKMGKILSQSSSGKAEGGLTAEEQDQVEQLKARDREVRAHEQAHVAAGGNLVRGGASFEYRTGPDGKLYAVGGEVTIDTSSIPNDPDATIRKATQIRAAALAPADPSPQDRSVAAEAASMQSKAQAEKAEKVSKVSGVEGSGATSSKVNLPQAAMAYSLKSESRSMTDRVVDA